MDRRQFVGILGAAAATSSIFAQGRKTVLPPRRELLLKDAYVMTMDPRLGILRAATFISGMARSPQWVKGSKRRARQLLTAEG